MRPALATASDGFGREGLSSHVVATRWERAILLNRDPETHRLRLADVLAALSVVTDIGHGQAPETAMRVCVVASMLAERLNLSGSERSHVYFAALLRHIGCTAYSHEEASLFGGDEIAMRAAVAAADMGNPREAISVTISTVGHQLPPPRRAGAVLSSLARTPKALKDLAASNCEVGTMMARRLDLPEKVQTALDQVYERWDGKGWPRRLRGEQLCVTVRLTMVADAAVAVMDASDHVTACEVISKRGGGMLDPEIATAFARDGAEMLAECTKDEIWERVLASEPEPLRAAGSGRIDGIAAAFADMADLKLTFTRGHSTEVARLAEVGARALGLSEDDITQVRRAGFFHDLGRLAVPNGIWEKAKSLSAADWERVRLHPYYSERILSRSAALAELAPIAGMHHERQDGSGYHWQLSKSAIPMPARLLAAADTYQALTSFRPHRPALSPREASRVMDREVSAGRLDGEAMRAVLEATGQKPTRRSTWPDGLTDREVEVLRLISRGASQKEVGAKLVISHRTAAHHIQHIYDKIGVSTRAGAAMYAMENELLAPAVAGG
jgi:HD-GYP domain-containing protein (c-di-GMP phosphodiesterase class II)